jgi:hypothetical protein
LVIALRVHIRQRGLIVLEVKEQAVLQALDCLLLRNTFGGVRHCSADTTGLSGKVG